MRERSRLAVDVAAELRALIARNSSPGERIPAESELAEQLGVSRNTLREALWLLWSEGLLVRRWGVGTFVRDRTPPSPSQLLEFVPVRDMIRGSGREPTLTVAVVERRPCVREAAVALGLREGEEAWWLDRTFAADGVPAVTLQDWVPSRVNGRELDLTPLKDVDQGLLGLLYDAARCRVVRMEAHLTAELASDEMAERMRQRQPFPVMVGVQVSYDDTDRPVIFSRNYYATGVFDVRVLRTVHRWQRPSVSGAGTPL
ncbi:MAG TPA: GntR family transcriptional regulator [Acidimicrobiales bacterium]|jgi:GntR family transcriptional regulator|nr:GntR family transcriptional regulator [Acidimicrobiales bacterium]